MSDDLTPGKDQKLDSEQSSEIVLTSQISATSEKRTSLKNIIRTVDEKELSKSATVIVKLLVDDLDRLENENESLKKYQGFFHEADKRASVLQQKLDDILNHEKIRTFFLAASGIIVGVGIAITPTSVLWGGVVSLLGTAVLIAAVFIKK